MLNITLAYDLPQVEAQHAIARVFVSSPVAVSWNEVLDLDLKVIALEQRTIVKKLARALRTQNGLHGLESSSQLLFDLVLPERLKGILRTEKGILMIHSPWQTMPWHLLNDGSVFLGERWQVTEMMSSDALALPAQHDEAESSALIVADPANDLPAARFEGESVMSSLENVSRLLQTEVRFGPLKTRDFIKSFKRQRVVHFAGHFDVESSAVLGWRFADGHLSPSRLRALRGGRAPELFFSNACSAANLSDESVLTDIGVKNYLAPIIDIPDLASADFATRFYRLLGKGRSVGDALQNATWEGVKFDDYIGLAYRLIGPATTRLFSRKDVLSERFVERRATFAFIRSGRPSSVDAYNHLREDAAMRADKHGGKLLPGASASIRVGFGLRASREDDRLRALNFAFELLSGKPGLVVGIVEARVTTDGYDAIAKELFELENDLLQLSDGVYAPAAMQVWLKSHVEIEAIDSRPLLKLMPISDKHRLINSFFVGRQTELERMQSLFRECVSTQTGRGILLTGPAGIGKTSLLYAFSDLVAHQCCMIHLYAPDYHEASPWRSLRRLIGQVFKQLVGIDVVDLATLKRAIDEMNEEQLAYQESIEVLTIDDLLSQPLRTTSWSRHLPVLAAVCQFQIPDSALEQEDIVVAVTALLRAAATIQPVLLCIDHFGNFEETSQQILTEIIQRLDTVSVFVLITSRYDARKKALALLETIAVKELSRRDCSLLVTQVCPELSKAQNKRIIEKAEGNPFFATQLAREFGKNEPEELPASIDVLLSARLDALQSEHRLLLQSAAVIGKTFTSGPLSALLADGDKAPIWLSDLVGLGCLRALSREQFAFAQHLFHQVVYRSMTDVQRRAAHGRYALWRTENLTQESAQSIVETARHFETSGDTERAASLRTKALEIAFEFSDFHLSGQIQKHLSLDDFARRSDMEDSRGLYFEVVGRLAMLAGDSPGCVTAFQSALENTPTGSEAWFKRLMCFLEGLSAIGDYEKALAHASRGLEVAVSLEDPDARQRSTVDIMVHRAWVWRAQEHTERATTELKEALAMCAPSNNAQCGSIRTALGAISLLGGDLDEASFHFEAAQNHHESIDNLRLLARTCNNLGIVFQKQGRFDEALSSYERAIRCHQERGDRNALAMLYNNLGGLYGEMGRTREAERFFRETIRMRRLSRHSGLAGALANLGKVLFDQHKLADAQETLEEAEELFDKGGVPAYVVPPIKLYQGRLALLANDIETARQAFLSGAGEEQVLSGRLRAEIELGLAECDLYNGDLRQAKARFMDAMSCVHIEKDASHIGRLYLQWSDALSRILPEEAAQARMWSVAFSRKGQYNGNTHEER